MAEIFTLTINTDSAAFDETPASEITRILRKAADQVDAGIFEGNLYDINGNKCGAFSVNSKPQHDEDGNIICNHDWHYTGTQYGGDDERYNGEGVVYCTKCGADGDA